MCVCVCVNAIKTCHNLEVMGGIDAIHQLITILYCYNS